MLHAMLGWWIERHYVSRAEHEAVVSAKDTLIRNQAKVIEALELAVSSGMDGNAEGVRVALGLLERIREELEGRRLH